MTKIEKAKLLKLLYQYRSLGFEYFKEYKPANMINQEISDNLGVMKEKVSNCHLCSISNSRKNVVFGEGNEDASLMFIGEAPGANEDKLGRPFVGKAGMLLVRIIENVLNLKREDVYITNIIKCRPPNNRVPTLEEVTSCKPYLLEQISVIKPKVIVALGSTSYHHLTGDYDIPISRVRGEVLEFADAKLIPTFHPSFLLRNPSAKKEVFLDMLKVKKLL